MKLTISRTVILSGVVGAALLTAGCSASDGAATLSTSALPTGQGAPSTAPQAKAAPARIALLLPLTAGGQTGLVATAMKQAAELALTDAGNPALQLVTKDTKGTPEGAKLAAEQALAEGAELVLGPLFGSSLRAAMPVLAAKRIAAISFSNDASITVAGANTIGFSAEQETTRIVSYAARQGKRRIIAFVPEDRFGQTTETALRSAAAASGSEVLAVQRYKATTVGIVEPVRRLMQMMGEAASSGAPVDALFLPGGSEYLINVAPVLARAGFDPVQVKILGTGGLDNPDLSQSNVLSGAWYAAVDPRGWQDFSQKYMRAYGAAPPRVASLAYDGVGIASALSFGDPAQRFGTEQLTRVGGFQGVDGQIRLSNQGAATRDLAVLQVSPFKHDVIEAPQASPTGAQASSAIRRVN